MIALVAYATIKLSLLLLNFLCPFFLTITLTFIRKDTDVVGNTCSSRRTSNFGMEC